MTIQRFHVGPRMSEAVVHNQTIYLAGQVAEIEIDLPEVGKVVDGQLA